MSTGTGKAVQSGQILAGDALEEIDGTLFRMMQMCRLIESLGSACRPDARTDGIDPEPFHVVFGWIGDELHDVRLALESVHRSLIS